MNKNLVTNGLAYTLLAAATMVSFMMPSELAPRSGQAAPPAPTLKVKGVVRDFKKGHPDFGVTPSAGNGHYAGNVTQTLSASGQPEFVGVSGGAVNNFSISNGATVPKVNYTPMVTVLGSAISYGGAYDCPVTVRLHVGSQNVTPFGDYDKALAGNVNTTGNPRKYVHPTSVAKDTPIWVEGRAWYKKSSSSNGKLESHWQEYSSYQSRPSSSQIKVLKNGDSVPSVDGFKDQASVKTFLRDFIDTKKKKVTLKENQTIYLFEFGSTSGSSADWQDLVVLVTLGETTSYLESLDATGNTTTSAPTAAGFKVAGQWRDGKGNPIPPHLFVAARDSAGSKGAASTGGLSNAVNFKQWFTDVLGTNLSEGHTLILTKNAAGEWAYSTDAFHPADNRLLGNEGEAHNFFFTYSFGAEFTPAAGASYFFEFEGSDDAWLYVDGKLAMDLGGVLVGTRQYVDFDRLGLSAGQKHRLDFFHANRQKTQAVFRLRTNLPLEGESATPTMTAAFD